MTTTIPLIRAASIAPVLRWLHEQGRTPAPSLAAAGLDGYPLDDPLAVIPLHAAILFLGNIARDDAPDAPFRIVGNHGFYELGLLGSMTLGGDTARNVLRRVAIAMKYHGSHEFLTLHQSADELVIRYGMQLHLPDEDCVHFVQQYCCGMIDMVFAMTGRSRPYFTHVQMLPHPDFGVSHMADIMRCPVSAGHVLEIAVARDVAEAPLIAKKPDMVPSLDSTRIRPLRTNCGASTSLARLVESAMKKAMPSLDQVVKSVGISKRTLQRALDEEGTSFSEIADAARKKEFLAAISRDNVSIGEISSRLGYARQATLTRAVRRWTGKTPSEMANLERDARQWKRTAE